MRRRYLWNIFGDLAQTSYFPTSPREESPALLLGLLIAKFGPKHTLFVRGTRLVSLCAHGIFLSAFGSLDRHREIKINDANVRAINVKS